MTQQKQTFHSRNAPSFQLFCAVVVVSINNRPTCFPLSFHKNFTVRTTSKLHVRKIGCAEPYWNGYTIDLLQTPIFVSPEEYICSSWNMKKYEFWVFECQNLHQSFLEKNEICWYEMTYCRGCAPTTDP